MVRQKLLLIYIYLNKDSIMCMDSVRIAPLSMLSGQQVVVVEIIQRVKFWMAILHGYAFSDMSKINFHPVILLFLIPSSSYRDEKYKQ